MSGGNLMTPRGVLRESMPYGLKLWYAVLLTQGTYANDIGHDGCQDGNTRLRQRACRGQVGEKGQSGR